MKTLRLYAVAAAILPTLLIGQTIWSGPTMTFTKTAFSDHTLPANQDFLTPNVILTRANTQGIFNIASETGYTDFSSPADTEWSFGTTAQIGSLTFDNWEDTHGSLPLTTLNQPMVVHLITDDIYIDITFTAWSAGNGQGNPSGGGFSYNRSTDNTTSVAELTNGAGFVLSPNPAIYGMTTIRLNVDLLDNATVTVFDVTGKIVSTAGSVQHGRSDVMELNLSDQNEGLYFVQVVSGDMVVTERLLVN